MNIKNLLHPIVYKLLINFYNDKIIKHRRLSYSQEGEDLILARIFEGKRKGFYVDIGAHHPRRFSNTYIFYKMGWNGINIEARPGSKKIFDKIRPRDINLELAISYESKTLTYFMFNDPALNSFDEEKSKEIDSTTSYKIIKKIQITTVKLSDVLQKYCNQDQTIDFMSVDTEGFDLSVLLSNDWEKYVPKFILCEDQTFDYLNPTKSEIYNFLVSKNYYLVSKTLNTLIFGLKNLS